MFNDIAESHSGLIFGISNTFASLISIIIPYYIKAVTCQYV
jgi:hypothetical protein